MEITCKSLGPNRGWGPERGNPLIDSFVLLDTTKLGRGEDMQKSLPKNRLGGTGTGRLLSSMGVIGKGSTVG